jgi:Holliday junction resolvasome RuvABC ATP-dependent DNA helicase subunit
VEAAVAVADDRPAPITFNEGEPTTFEEYDGQSSFLPFLAKAVRSLPEGQAKLDRHELFVGPAGLGKSVLAKVIAAELFAVLAARGLRTPHFLLAVGSDLRKPGKLDALWRKAASREGSVVFLDEVHTLVEAGFHDKLLLLLTDHRWQFDEDDAPSELPDFTIIAATTDWGKLSEAMRRRFEVRELEPMTPDQLRRVVAAQRVPCTDEALDRIVHYTKWDGAPWQALALYKQATVLARHDGRPQVKLSDIEEIAAVKGLDEYGLTPTERRALTTLLLHRRVVKGKRKDEPDDVLYVLSEANLIGAARVDPTAFRDYIKPRLIARNFLLPSSRGLQLTPLAVATYGGDPTPTTN